ncbi:MAG: hypothetical protein P8012_00045 [Desulfobacterales bacterium]
MNKSQIAEIVLDVRSLWQIYYVEGIIASKYIKLYRLWGMKSEIAELAGLCRSIKHGCPLCEYFFNEDSECERCPLDWPRKGPDHIPCEREKSPYYFWKKAKTIKQARSACDGMIELCEKWLDENGIEYEK